MSVPPSLPNSVADSVDPALWRFLRGAGLAQPDSDMDVIALPGGVSCDVWRVHVDGQFICVKRALPRLRVAKLWEAPNSRSESEWDWLNFVRTIAPKAVPRTLAHDAKAGMIAVEYLDPAEFPVWKQLLLTGVVQTDTASALGSLLARIHAASAGNPEIAERFRTHDAFYALRIEPYLLEAARQNPGVSGSLNRFAEQTLATEIALVHGDFSPKNILVGPQGPVILDAETAWYGDPAFDVAFCLNHLLLKCVARPQFADAYLRCFESFRTTYLSSASWEPASDLESRTARLLPALLLARVDGKSPVEYLDENEQTFVRAGAIGLIQGAPARLDEIANVWKGGVSGFHSRQALPPSG